MSFVKKEWHNKGESVKTPISADGLNDLENRIASLDTSLTNLINKVTYGNGTMNEENLSAGNCNYAKIGNLILVRFDSVTATKALSATDNLFTNLPANSTTAFGYLANITNNDIVRIAINSGNVRVNYDSLGQAGSYSGLLWYRADS